MLEFDLKTLSSIPGVFTTFNTLKISCTDIYLPPFLRCIILKLISLFRLLITILVLSFAQLAAVNTNEAEMENPTKIVGVIPPPPGLEANFVNPPSQMTGNIILHSVCLSLVTLTVAVRLYTRKHINRGLSVDDCKSLAAVRHVVIY